MGIEFCTIEYVFSHGHTPRGRGSWAFATTRDPDVSGSGIFWTPSVTYTEAKVLAREHFVNKAARVWVLP